jgi:hypothetical protein
MSDRETLPTMREGETVDFEHRDHLYTGSAGHYPDGTDRRGVPAHQQDRNASGRHHARFRDSGVAGASARLPVETLRKAFLRNEDGTAASPMGQLFELLARDGK